MILARLHRDPDLPRLALVLVLVLVAQALLPLQTHTRVVLTPQGIARQVCTLYGAPPAADPQPGERDTPAMVFSQLAAELLPGIPPALPPAQLVATRVLRVELPAAAPSTAAAMLRIRAPPLA